MKVKLIHERIEEIHGKMVIFRAWETKATGYTIKVKGRIYSEKGRKIMRQFRAAVEQMVNK